MPRRKRVTAAERLRLCQEEAAYHTITAKSILSLPGTSVSTWHLRHYVHSCTVVADDSTPKAETL